MLGVETLATQTLATSARETPLVSRFVAVQELASYDLIYLVELQPYLPAAGGVAPGLPPVLPPTTQVFGWSGHGGGVSSGIAQYSLQRVPTGVVKVYSASGGAVSAGAANAFRLVGGVARVYQGAGGGITTGAALTQITVAPPVAMPSVPGLWAHYDADSSAASLSFAGANSVTAWADSSGITGGAPDIGLSLDFSALTPDLDLTFARASSKVAYRSGPTIVLTGSGQQSLTTSLDGTTSLGLMVEGAMTQLLQNSKLSGGGVTPTGWSTIVAGSTRSPVASALGNADGATAYTMTVATSAERPFLGRPITLADNTKYTVSMIVESNTSTQGQAAITVIGNLGTGSVGSATSADVSTITGPFPKVFSNTFTTGTGNTVSSIRFGLGTQTTGGSGTMVLSRPSVVAVAGPASFIPSDNGQTPTFPADVGSVALTASNWNDTGNTLVLQGRTASFMGSVEQHFFQIDSGGFNNSMTLLRWTDRHLHYQIWNGGTNQVDIDFGLVPDDTDFTVRVANAANNVRASFNGGAVVPDTTVVLPPGMTMLRVGMETTGGTEWWGTISKLEIWKSAKPDSELQNGIIMQGAGGGGPVLSQSVSANRPTRLVKAQAGRDTVSFTSAAFSYLASGLTTAFDAFWTGGAYILVAARIPTLGAQSAGRFIYRAAGTGGWLIRLQAGSAGNAQLYFNLGYTTTSAVYVSSDFALGSQFRLLEIAFDSSTPATPPVMRFNGAPLTVTTQTAAVGSYTEAANQPLTFSDPTFAFNGEYGDVVFYGSVPTAAEQLSLRNWATTKWQVS